MNNKIKKNISNEAGKVMVFGTFDGLHPGHLDFFKQARRLGDELVIVVARDANVKKIKGCRPRLEEGERLRGLRKAISDPLTIVRGRQRSSDQVVLGGLKDPYAIIKKEKPEVIALGYDQKSFDRDLKKKFSEIRIIRLKPYKAGIYKSSKLVNLKAKRTPQCHTGQAS